MSTQSIVDILKLCRKETNLGDLLIETVQFKSSLLMYLRFMKKKKFLTYRRDGRITYYKTTSKGKTLMRLLDYTDKVSIHSQRWK